MHCTRCGSAIEDGSSRFCPYCGASQAEPLESQAGEPLLTTTVSAGQTARCAAHPEAEAAELCSRCGAFACRACISLAPGGKVLCAACVARDGAGWTVPWERRAELGLFKAYWETTRGLLLHPGECFGGMASATGRWWDPISYALVSSFIGFSGFALVYGLVFGASALGAHFGAKGDSAVGLGLAGMGMAMALLVLVSGLAMVPITVFAWGGIEHLMLRLFGVPTRGFEATVRASCYAHAPMLLGLVPICGYYVYPVWQLVLRILGFRGLHRTSGGRSAAAVLVPIGAFFAFAGLLYAASFAAMFALGQK